MVKVATFILLLFVMVIKFAGSVWSWLQCVMLFEHWIIVWWLWFCFLIFEWCQCHSQTITVCPMSILHTILSMWSILVYYQAMTMVGSPLNQAKWCGRFVCLGVLPTCMVELHLVVGCTRWSLPFVDKV